MKTQYKFIHRLKDQRGASAIIIAIVLAVLIGFAALAIDVGYLYATRNELQNVADAAALAAAGQLGYLYTDILTPAQVAVYVYSDTNEPQIKDAAEEIGLENRAAGKDVIIDENDVEVGIWDLDNRTFSADPNQPNAVRVQTRRDDTVATGKVALFFARLLNIDEAAVTAFATAALTPPDSVLTGKLKLPIGLSELYYPPEGNECNEPITLSPTPDSCAGWHNFIADNINAADLEARLLGLIKGHPNTDPEPGEEPETCPEGLTCGGAWFIENFQWTQAQVDALLSATTPSADEDTEFIFQGGDVASLFNGGYLVWDENDNTIPVSDPEDPTRQLVEKDADKPAPIIALFDYFRFRDGDLNDVPPCPGGECYTADQKWTTTIPIYKDQEQGDPEEEDCINPQGDLEIEGFDLIEVIEVRPPNNDEGVGRSLKVRRDCTMRVINDRGGGGEGLILGSIPNLVE